MRQTRLATSWSQRVRIGETTTKHQNTSLRSGVAVCPEDFRTRVGKTRVRCEDAFHSDRKIGAGGRDYQERGFSRRERGVPRALPELSPGENGAKGGVPPCLLCS